MSSFSATPTAAQYIVTFLRNNASSFSLPVTSINFGLADNLKPPYIAVNEYEHEIQYDVSGPAARNSKWKLHVFHQDFQSCENLAATIDSTVNMSTAITPYCVGTFQESWQTVQEDLYVFHTQLEYSMQESIHQP